MLSRERRGQRYQQAGDHVPDRSLDVAELADRLAMLSHQHGLQRAQHRRSHRLDRLPQTCDRRKTLVMMG